MRGDQAEAGHVLVQAPVTVGVARVDGVDRVDGVGVAGVQAGWVIVLSAAGLAVSIVEPHVLLLLLLKLWMLCHGPLGVAAGDGAKALD